MGSPLPSTKTPMANAPQGFSAPLPRPATAPSSPAPYQQPSASTDTLIHQLPRHSSPQPEQHEERRRHPRSTLAASPLASPSSSASSPSPFLYAPHMDAYEAAAAVATLRTDAGGSLLQRPSTSPLLPVKSYGTASDISDASSCSSLSAVVAVQTTNDTVDWARTQTVGNNITRSTRAELQACVAEQHQSLNHTQQGEDQAMPGYVVEAPLYDPHTSTPLDGNAHPVGEVGQREPSPLAEGAAYAPLAAGGGANGVAAQAEGGQPCSPTTDANANGPAPASLLLTWGSPTGSPPTFMELVVRRVQATSLLQLLWVALLVTMLLVGNAFQVIFLNFWIHQFPTNRSEAATSGFSSSSSSASSSGGAERAKALASSYTTFVISAVLFPSFFLVLSIAYALWRRPNLAFTRDRAGWWLLLGIGAMDALNSAMAIYAAANTPEVLQALFVSLVPIYSAVFTKWLLKDPRDYTNPYVVVSFVLIATGVALASLFNYIVTHRHHTKDGSGRSQAVVGGHGMPKEFQLDTFADGSSSSLSAMALDQRLWCLIFFLSVPPTVLMNVWQTMYMIRYTSSDELTAYLTEHADEVEYLEGDDGTAAAAAGQHAQLLDGAVHQPPSGNPAPGPSLGGPGHRPHAPHSEVPLHGEDVSVKLVMLTSDTAIQAILALVMMPMDALPWFGGSNSIREVVENLSEGVDCVLHCPRNMRYCILYSTGFVLVYIASAYLNRYSVTLCSMVSQLSGPITALVLIIFPSLNITGDASPWYVSVFAVLLLSCGTVLYVYWDEMTVEEKAVGEMKLKWEMMHAKSSRHAQSSAGGHSYHEIDSSTLATSQPQHHRHPRSRRYHRRRQSDYVVVFDQDPADPAANVQQHPH
ncbi:hypothetical_protein (plasmid) [Leishmania braziliensis MHOM/BR/75/M2904]|nr:hypothetical_protein [Leishmania braziliensis MHOM/BR/75/M2904]